MTSAASSHWPFFVVSGAVYGVCGERTPLALVRGSAAGGVAALLARRLPSGVVAVGLPLLRHAVQGGPAGAGASEAVKVAGNVAVYVLATSLLHGVAMPAVALGAGTYAVDAAVDKWQPLIAAAAGKLMKQRAKL